MLSFAGANTESAIRFVSEVISPELTPVTLVHAAIGVRLEEGQMDAGLVKTALGSVTASAGFCGLPAELRDSIRERIKASDVLDENIEPPIYDLLSQIRKNDSMYPNTDVRLAQ